MQLTARSISSSLARQQFFAAIAVAPGMIKFTSWLKTGLDLRDLFWTTYPDTAANCDFCAGKNQSMKQAQQHCPAHFFCIASDTPLLGPAGMTQAAHEVGR